MYKRLDALVENRFALDVKAMTIVPAAVSKNKDGFKMF
jgi:hypothetical protein